MEELIEYMKLTSKKNLRLLVIEGTIMIEELASGVLASILEIDLDKSVTLGNSSRSFSYNQKMLLIQDLSTVGKEERKKIETLAEIRNKFAHVAKAYSFNNLFEDDRFGKPLRRQLDKWYLPDDIGEILPEDVEKVYRLFFYILLFEVREELMRIVGDISFKRGEAAGRYDAKAELLDLMFERLKELDLGLVALLVIEEYRKKQNMQ